MFSIKLPIILNVFCFLSANQNEADGNQAASDIDRAPNQDEGDTQRQYQIGVTTYNAHPLA